MTRTRRRRLLLVASLLVGLGGAVALGLSAFSQNLLYFHQPSDIVAGHVPVDTRFRIGGLVKSGTIERSDQSLAVYFDVADCDASVPVVYHGTLPDLFRAGQGVIAYGKLDNRGEFIADRILAKHDSDYMSPETAEALKTKDNVPCMPDRMQASR